MSLFEMPRGYTAISSRASYEGTAENARVQLILTSQVKKFLLFPYLCLKASPPLKCMQKPLNGLLFVASSRLKAPSIALLIFVQSILSRVLSAGGLPF